MRALQLVTFCHFSSALRATLTPRNSFYGHTVANSDIEQFLHKVERNIIVLSNAEKNSNPRIWKVSNCLMQKLNSLQKQNEYVFPNRLRQSVRQTFAIQRKRIAQKLGNPRLTQITFRTFRHWKATMEYHKTRGILHTMEFLRHKNIKNTLVYTQLVKFNESEDYYGSTAKTAEEAKKLIESGFEYVCTTPENIMIFRKRK